MEGKNSSDEEKVKKVKRLPKKRKQVEKHISLKTEVPSKIATDAKKRSGTDSVEGNVINNAKNDEEGGKMSDFEAEDFPEGGSKGAGKSKWDTSSDSEIEAVLKDQKKESSKSKTKDEKSGKSGKSEERRDRHSHRSEKSDGHSS